MTKKEVMEQMTKYKTPFALSYVDFFEGNVYDGTIGVNLDPPLAPDKFYSVFKNLINSGLVSEIFIPIRDVEEPIGWFYSDSAYIIGKIKREELIGFVKVLGPDEVYDGFLYGSPTNIIMDTGGMNTYTLWWD